MLILELRPLQILYYFHILHIFHYFIGVTLLKFYAMQLHLFGQNYDEQQPITGG